MNLNTVRLFVHDLKVARDFYAQVLGLPLLHDGMAYGYCVFQAGATQLVIESVPPDAPAEDQILVGRFTGLSFEVASAQESYTRLSAQGVVFTEAPERQGWGGVVASFKDPSGNVLQLCEMPTAV